VVKLPSGTVTLLFTDIEGSTRLLSEHGERYADALAEHRRRLRDALARHGGVEVDTQGDAFFYAFGDAKDAVAAAQEAQRALAGGPISVRIGVHTGEPQVTGEGYVGMDVHRAARICATAHGGQVVLSEQTRSLLGDDFSLMDLGLHRLKDLGRAEKLFQLGGGAFPPLRSLSASNLPAQPSPLVGRTREVEEVLAHVRHGSRLVTLIGPGGTGKTRLALQVATDLLDDFVDGVFWIPLAAVRDPELVVSTVEQALGATVPLHLHVDEKRMLFLLDNLEQVVEAASALSDVLAACPNLHVLVTSRVLLRVRGEREYAVPPLPTDDAVALFRARAADAEPEAVVAEICRRIDGLPLAIELAAARTRVLPPERLLQRLEHRLPLLTGGARDAPERQRTLQATIEWSYDLLSAEEQVLFARLAVFVGGFTLEAADEVCQADLATLELLVENSLVRRTGERYSMLETIREYALERLQASGEAGRIGALYSRYFLALAEHAEPELRGREHARPLERLDAEHVNLRAALAWFRSHADGREGGLRLASALLLFWILRGYLKEGRGAVAGQLEGATPENPNGVRAKALAAGGLLAVFDGDLDSAASLCREALPLSRETGEHWHTAISLNVLGTAARFGGRHDEARDFYEQALALARERGYTWPAALAFCNLGIQAFQLDDHLRAGEVLEEGLTLARLAGDKFFTACTLTLLGRVAQERGEYDSARALHEESLVHFEALANRWGIAVALDGIAALAAAQGEPLRAARVHGSAEAVREAVHAILWPAIRAHYDRNLGAARAALPEHAFAAAWAEGRAMTQEEAVSYALQVGSRATALTAAHRA
jgi:predicted ATPase